VQKLENGTGSETAGSSVTIDSAAPSTGVIAPEKEVLHGKPNPFRAHQETVSGVVPCMVFGRSVPWHASTPRSP